MSTINEHKGYALRQHTHTYTHACTELEQQLVGKWKYKKLQGFVWDLSGISAVSVALPNVNSTGDTIPLVVVKVWSHVMYSILLQNRIAAYFDQSKCSADKPRET